MVLCPVELKKIQCKIRERGQKRVYKAYYRCDQIHTHPHEKTNTGHNKGSISSQLEEYTKQERWEREMPMAFLTWHAVDRMAYLHISKR